MHAASYTAIVLLSNLLRVMFFSVLYKIPVHKKERLKGLLLTQITKSWALIRWSLSSKDRFPDLVWGIFKKISDSDLPKLDRAARIQLKTGSCSD